MSTTSLGLGLGIGFKIAWMKTPDMQFWGWTQAAQRLWLWLKKPTHGDQTQFRFTDRQLANELGVGRRCVQYALQWLEDQGIIRRTYLYGPRETAGRVIEIIIQLAGKEPATKPPAPPQPRQAPPCPTPAPPQPDDATPRRRLGEPPTPEEILNGQAIAAEIRKAIALSRQQDAHAANTAQPARDRDQQQPDSEEARLRFTLDSINRRIVQARRLTGADSDPVIRGEIARLEQAQATVTAELDQLTPARE